jgi:transcription antitermination factor NusG
MLSAESFEKLDGNSGSTWYAVYTRHQHEKTVAQLLAMKGFRTLLPLYQAVHAWADRSKIVHLPLFPCYVFIRGGLERRLHILTTPGIRGLVSCGRRPAAIAPHEIEAFQRVVGNGFRVEPHPLLKCGDWVQVKSGPLQGIRGLLVRKKSVWRLVLSVEILGKAAAVEVDSLQVERLHRGRMRDRSNGAKVAGYRFEAA